jgi:glucose-1-phosphate cytidylyltransferase
MKVVILAGGFGTRLSEYTGTIPKPMVPIGGRPIIEHIIDIYSNFGHKEFYIALGYKGKIIKDYFKKKNKKNIKINLVETGIGTLTGGRIKKLEQFLKNDTFLLTYGDGVSDVNINSLIKLHKKNKKLVTITAVRPPARFGAMQLKGNNVVKFKEKTQLGESWINGGFFVINPGFFKFIKGSKSILERGPLEKATKLNKVQAYKHKGFWQCMDHKIDKDILDKMCRNKKPIWLK